MKKETVLFVVVALLAGLIVGWMVARKSSEPASSSEAPRPAVGPGPVPTVNFQQKVDQLKAVVAQDPKNRQAWVAIGNEYFDADRPMESIEAYQKALDLDANDANVLTDQGVMFRRMGWFDRAIENFTKANRVAPNHSASLYNLGITYRYDLQDAGKAREAWTKFLTVNPSGPGSDRVRQELALLDATPAKP